MYAASRASKSGAASGPAGAGPGDRGAAAPGESRREWKGEGGGAEPSPAANGRGGLAAVIAAALGPPPRCSWKRVRSNSINQSIDRSIDGVSPLPTLITITDNKGQ